MDAYDVFSLATYRFGVTATGALHLRIGKNVLFNPLRGIGLFDQAILNKSGGAPP